MKKYLTGAIFILVGLIFLVLIVYFIFIHRFDQDTGTDTPIPQDPGSVPITGVPAEPGKGNTEPLSVKMKISLADPSKKQVMTKEEASRMAMNFTERYGSYSNQSGYSNLSELTIFMTPKMQKWMAGNIREMQSKSAGSIYYGVSTKAITIEARLYDEEEGKAQFLVKTQRRESFGSPDNTSVSYKDIVIEMEKAGEAWKINSAFWQ